MAIIGWILWVVVCIWASSFLYTAIMYYGKDRSLRKLVLGLMVVAGLFGSLCVTALFDISKLHLLWLVPVSYGASNLFWAFILYLFGFRAGDKTSRRR